MKLTFLGSACGLATNINNFQSNMILCTDSGKKLLIDCGTDIRFSLHHAQYMPQDIDAVYLSHLHADHIGGIEWFVLHRKFMSQVQAPLLIIHQALVDQLWEHSLSGGLKTLREKEAGLEDYFKVKKVKDNEVYEWEGLTLKLIKTIHFFSNEKLMPSFGLNIHYDGKSYLITADTQFAPELFDPYYQEATLIFHDCETLAVASGVHAHFKQLNTLEPHIKAKLWLYHYNDGVLPDAKSHGFLGFVRRGQSIEL